MTTAVLQAHHAVQTLPEVSPEFTQAIVQTDISGPITASDLANAELAHTGIAKSVSDAELQENEVVQDDVSHTVDQTSINSSSLEQHAGLPAEIQVQGSGDKHMQTIKTAGEIHLPLTFISLLCRDRILSEFLRTTLCSAINSTTGNECSIAFI